MLQSPPVRQKVDGLGDHAGLPIRETGKGGKNLTLYSGHVTHNTSTQQHLLKILGTTWGAKVRRKIRRKYTIFEIMDLLCTRRPRLG
jgi:hypothetical protein